MLRHRTDMEVDRQYTDTHGASTVGFGFAHMLDFKLIPRLKNIGSARLYRPAAGEDKNWPNLALVLSTKTINWDLIRQQYDQIVNPQGLQVVENWNSANKAPCYGKDGDLAGQDKEAQEVSTLALHLLQSALVHVNTRC
ncbi:Tn3 family transposase [Streptomyces sp. NPDC002054]|uniref:Tn3 family transposase n=1 Tax=Streptomyces sp. NPDC002054 TaxID=3154663 RepID=UPI00331B1107